MVITYSVMNYDNKTFQKMAEAWEETFLELIENYESDNISISYSAQVGKTKEK